LPSIIALERYFIDITLAGGTLYFTPFNISYLLVFRQERILLNCPAAISLFEFITVTIRIEHEICIQEESKPELTALNRLKDKKSKPGIKINKEQGL
jgi:hypothetical protein